MQEYYVIVSRDNFIKLIKFGKFQSFIYYMVDVKESDLEVKLKEKINKVDFLSGEEEEIIILKINNKNTEANIEEWYTVKIENVQRYYLLSEKSKLFYTTKVSSKFKYEIFYENTNLLYDIEEVKEIIDMRRGQEILLKQFDLKDDFDNGFNEVFLKEVRNYLKSKNYLKLDYESFEFDVLSYRRKNKFIPTDLSYIYDLMIILVLKDRKEETVNRFYGEGIPIENSKTSKLLNEEKNLNLLGYIKFMKNSTDENVKKFFSSLGEHQLVKGLLFLKFRDLKENNNLEGIKEYIETFVPEYRKEVILALSYIGIIFGYEKLRDYYYYSIDCFVDPINKNAMKDCIKEESLKVSLSESVTKNSGNKNIKLPLENIRKTKNEELEKEKDIIGGIFSVEKNRTNGYSRKKIQNDIHEHQKMLKESLNDKNSIISLKNYEVEPKVIGDKILKKLKKKNSELKVSYNIKSIKIKSNKGMIIDLKKNQNVEKITIYLNYISELNNKEKIRTFKQCGFKYNKDKLTLTLKEDYIFDEKFFENFEL